MNVEIEPQPMRVKEDFRLMQTEKAIVTLGAGTIWTLLKYSDRPIGIAFSGPSRFAVDAIVETDFGATGESISANLKGVQLYLGIPDLNAISEPATAYDLEQVGYTSTGEFIEHVQKKLDGNRREKDNRFEVEGDAGILIGMDEHRKKVILVAKENSTILTYGKKVFVMGEDGEGVTVEGSRISVGGPDRRTLIIDEDGIKGLEELNRIGPAVARAVSSVIRTVPRFAKHIDRSFREVKHRHDYRAYGAYDNVDEFDWPD